MRGRGLTSIQSGRAKNETSTHATRSTPEKGGDSLSPKTMRLRHALPHVLGRGAHIYAVPHRAPTLRYSQRQLLHPRASRPESASSRAQSWKSPAQQHLRLFSTSSHSRCSIDKMAEQKEIRKYLQESHDKIFESNRKWAEEQRAKNPEFFDKLSAGQSPDYLWIGTSIAHYHLLQRTSFSIALSIQKIGAGSMARVVVGMYDKADACQAAPIPASPPKPSPVSVRAKCSSTATSPISSATPI